jgi:hypothetical protein
MRGWRPQTSRLAVSALIAVAGFLSNVQTTLAASTCLASTCRAGNVAQVSTASSASWVVRENSLPGTSDWRIPPGTPRGIQGFADHVSVQVGHKVTLYVSTKAATFRVRAYRLGYYQGLGGRLIWTTQRLTGTEQPAPTITSDTNTVRTDWSPSITLTIGTRWVQGNYLLKLVDSNGAEAYVPLVVRDDSSKAALLIIQSVTTWEAYNLWGGADLYLGTDGTYATRSRIVTFDRPYGGRGASGLLTVLPYISLIERKGLDITYSTDVDLEQHPSLLLNHKAVISLSHDEYWSKGMRDAVESARSHGVNVAFLGANAVYRQIRFQSTPLGADRDVICYKSASEDPLFGVDDPVVTVNWRQYPVSRPESSLLGPMYQCDHVQVDMVVADASAWVFAGTNLANGDHLRGAVDMEYDSIFPSAPTPGSIQLLSHSPVHCHGQNNYADMTYYTASSGAGVFDVASQGWVKLLQCAPPVASSTCNRKAVTITTNVLAAFASGPAGERHPSQPNLSKFGITLTDPTNP